MRQFTYIEPITTTFHMAGQTVSFVNGVCQLANPSLIQLGWLDEKIAQGFVFETAIEIPLKKKINLSKPAAKKKRG